MGGFKVVYHEALAEARQQAGNNTAQGSSYREFLDTENPGWTSCAPLRPAPGEEFANPALIAIPGCVMNVRPGSCRPRLLVPALILLSRLGAGIRAAGPVGVGPRPNLRSGGAQNAPAAPPRNCRQPRLAAPERPAGDQVLVPALRGLVFPDQRDALQVQGWRRKAARRRRRPAGNCGISRARDPLSWATAQSARPRPATRDVVLYFRQHGRPVVDVLVPEQNVSSGTVQILVIEGRLGRLRVEATNGSAPGKSWPRSAPAPARSSKAPLARGPRLINENAFREVDLVFTRGRIPGDRHHLAHARPLPGAQLRGL